MKIILVPTDFLDASRKALQQALLFAKLCSEECKILLLNTYLIPASAPSQLVQVHDDLRKKSQEKLKEELQWIQKEKASTQLSFEILSYLGSLENVLSNLSEERHIDYIFLGTNEESRYDELVKILRRVSCPLLIVPFKKTNI